jgi:hypothetical protein
VRFKLGPATFIAGLPEPIFSVISEVEWAGPLRRLGEVEIKKRIPVLPILEVKIRCPGMQARTEIATTRSGIPPRANDTRPQVISENRLQNFQVLESMVLVAMRPRPSRQVRQTRRHLRVMFQVT